MVNHVMCAPANLYFLQSLFAWSFEFHFAVPKVDSKHSPAKALQYIWNVAYAWLAFMRYLSVPNDSEFSEIVTLPLLGYYSTSLLLDILNFELNQSSCKKIEKPCLLFGFNLQIKPNNIMTKED